MFCPTVNGIQAIKSNFAMFWGVEPAQLTATISIDTPPSTITYGGKHVSLDMTVINWTKVVDGTYIIQAADDPYFWKNLRLTVKYDDPVLGVDIKKLAEAIESETGWSVVLSSEEKVPTLLFSGSVIEAINVLEKLSGKFATLDHVNKEIIFVDTIPHGNIPEGVIVEDSSEKPTIDKAICYGTLLKLSQDNFLAAYETNIDDYKYLDMAVPSEGWEITTSMTLGTAETVTLKEVQNVNTYEPFRTGNVSYVIQIIRETVERGVNIAFVATTVALKQDEVILVPSLPADVDLSETTHEVRMREFGGEVFFDPPEGADTINLSTGEPSVSFATERLKEDRVFFLNDPNKASTKASEILDMLSQDKQGIYVIVTPNFPNTSESTTSDYYFGFRVFVVGKIYMPYTRYVQETTIEVVNGVMRASPTAGVSTVPDAPNLDTAFISLYLRERLLRNLRFRVLLDGYRVKFPYFASSDGTVGKDIDPNQDKTMFIQLNEAPSIDVAKRYAKISLDLLQRSGYVGVLDVPPDGSTRYVEDFGGNLFRAIAYFRK